MSDLRTRAREAMAVIQDRGWCQGAYGGQYGVCVVGAVNVSAGRSPAFGESRDPLFREIRRRIVGTTVEGWNDGPTRTVEQVLDLLSSIADDRPWEVVP